MSYEKTLPLVSKEVVVAVVRLVGLLGVGWGCSSVVVVHWLDLEVAVAWSL